MKRLLLLILSLAIIDISWALSPTMLDLSTHSSDEGECSGTYGDTAGANEAAASTFIIRLRPITIDCDSPASYSIKAVLKDIHSDIVEVKFLIYDDDGAGADAGTRLYESSAMFDASTSGVFKTIECSGVTTSLSSGKYWVGILFESTGNLSDFQYDGTTGDLTLKHIQGDFTSPATWDTEADSTSTAQDCYYFDF